MTLDSIKRHIPGTNPLTPLPFNAQERAELIARVRAAGWRVRANGGRAKRDTTIPPKRLAELRAERAVEREQARVAARALRVAEGVVVVAVPASRRPAKARPAPPPVDPPIPFWLLPTGPVRK